MNWDLVSDIWPGITDVAVHLAQYANMLVAVQERVFVFTMHACAARASVRSLVRLETGIGKYDYEPLRVLVGRRDRSVLLGHKLRQGWRRERLRSCHDGKDHSQQSILARDATMDATRDATRKPVLTAGTSCLLGRLTPERRSGEDIVGSEPINAEL